MRSIILCIVLLFINIHSVMAEPNWATLNYYEDCEWEYYVGQGEGRSSVEAQKSAMRASLESILSRRSTTQIGGEFFSREEVVDQDRKRRIIDEIIAKGQTVEIGQIIRVKTAAERESKDNYIGYALLKVKKEIPTSWAMCMKEGVGDRLGTLVRSAAVPGWGQFRGENYGRSVFFFVSVIGTAAAAGLYALEYDNKSSDKKNKLDQFNSSHDPTERSRLDKEIRSLSSQVDDAEKYRNGLAIVAGGLYALNLVDAFLFTKIPPYKKTYFSFIYHPSFAQMTFRYEF